MNNLKPFLLIFSSLLLGSSLSLIFSPIIAQNLPFELFSKDIPSVSDELIFKKTFDLLDFLLTVLLSGAFYFINSFFLGRQTSSNQSLSVILLFILSITIFLQTHFVSFSKTHMLGLLVLTEILYIGLNLIKKPFLPLFSAFKDIGNPKLAIGIFNGAFLGFYLLLFLNNILQIPMLSVLVFLICPFLFALLSPQKPSVFEKFPGALLLLSVFFPQNQLGLAVLGGLIALIWLGLIFFNKNPFKARVLVQFLYPSLLIFLFAYNPYFFVGNFDTVEEGFLLGWVERLYQGQYLYKDAAAYHPPYLPWALFGFSKFFGHTVYSERLFLHILQILGALIYFFLLKKVLKNPLNILLGFILFLSLVSIGIRNNIEIRVSLGLLSLLLLFNYFHLKRGLWIFLSGAALSVSIFTSLEVGLVALSAIFLSLNLLSDKLFSRSQLSCNLLLFSGFVTASLPAFFYLFLTGSLLPFFEQISFYVSAFSKGYFNLALERSVSLAYFHWHIFNQYTSSNAFYWEITKLLLTGGFVYGLIKLLKLRKEFTIEDKYIFSLSIFGLLLIRTALGRSDIYHLLSALIIALIVLLFYLERLQYISKSLFFLTWFALLFYFFRPAVNSVFLENQLYKFQTFGKVLGDYHKYESSPLGKLLVGQEIDTKQADTLIKFVQSETSQDETIFVYPWMPELYFYAQRRNATSFDTPYAFFSEKYQRRMISELESSKPKLIIFNPEMNFGDLTPKSLPLLNKYILDNFEETDVFGQNRVLKRKG
jgi:hypothetical protein